MSTSELHTTVDARRRSIQLVYSEQRQNVLHTPNMRMSEMTSNFWLHLTINNTMQDKVEQQTYTQYVRVFRGYNLPSVCIKVSKYKNGISSFSNQRESTKPALTELIDPCFTHSRSSSFSRCFLTGICFFLSRKSVLPVRDVIGANGAMLLYCVRHRRLRANWVSFTASCCYIAAYASL